MDTTCVYCDEAIQTFRNNGTLRCGHHAHISCLVEHVVTQEDTECPFCQVDCSVGMESDPHGFNCAMCEETDSDEGMETEAEMETETEMETEMEIEEREYSQADEPNEPMQVNEAAQTSWEEVADAVREENNRAFEEMVNNDYDMALQPDFNEDELSDIETVSELNSDDEDIVNELAEIMADESDDENNDENDEEGQVLFIDVYGNVTEQPDTLNELNLQNHPHIVNGRDIFSSNNGNAEEHNHYLIDNNLKIWKKLGDDNYYKFAMVSSVSGELGFVKLNQYTTESEEHVACSYDGIHCDWDFYSKVEFNHFGSMMPRQGNYRRSHVNTNDHEGLLWFEPDNNPGDFICIGMYADSMGYKGPILFENRFELIRDIDVY